MLAQIERGTANPSLGVLGKITSGLRIEFQELIQPPRVDCCLVTPAELVPTKEIAGQYRVWTCLPYEDTRLVEVYRIEVEPGGVYISGSHGEKTREYLAVMEGVLTLECHGEKYEIHRDQVFKFETDQEHVYRNTGKEKACCTCFFSGLSLMQLYQEFCCCSGLPQVENPVCRILPCMIGGLP